MGKNNIWLKVSWNLYLLNIAQSVFAYLGLKNCQCSAMLGLK